ncbi:MULTISPECIES: hypothetical protein [Methylobacterium]|uniref:hypothetical protein n=1 Tax=Methylobacterium TaxID=407 RepID=UPI002F357238
MSFAPSMQDDLFGSSSMSRTSRKKMKQSQVSTPAFVGERHAVAGRLCSFLRGRHPVKTAENVAAETGIPVATVASWLDRGSSPNAWALLSLVGAYGADVLCAAMENPPAWLRAAARQAERERVEAEIAALRAKLDEVQL